MGTIEELVNAATSPDLSRPDNNLISGIIDHISANPHDSPAAAHSVKIRLEEDDVKVQMFALFVLDKCMKKLGLDF
jgi:hypothetical protein